MDSSLLKDFNAFKKKSLATPVVESKNTNNVQQTHSSTPSKRKVKRKTELPPQLLQQAKKQATQQNFNYKTHGSIRTKSRFSILQSIVDFLKKSYQSKDFRSFSLDDLLDKSNNTDMKPSDKEWLKEALKQNPKITIQDLNYSFKPKYAIKDKKSLLKLLDKHEQQGLGGILLDDIREGLPNADDIIKSIIKADRVMFVTRTTDKKDILFNYDSSLAMNVDDEFHKHWRSVAVEGLAEPDIEKYLTSSGITTMQGVAPKTQKIQKRRGGKRRKNGKLLNNHLQGGVLKDYSETSGKK